MSDFIKANSTKKPGTWAHRPRTGKEERAYIQMLRWKSREVIGFTKDGAPIRLRLEQVDEVLNPKKAGGE